jgi:predicted MFS family arabinose efflux permease
MTSATGIRRSVPNLPAEGLGPASPAAALCNKAASSRPPLITRPLLLRFVSLIGAAVSFNLLLSVVPLYAVSTGAGGGAAGLANGAMLFAAVAGELATARLVARHGYRRVLMAGLLLLGAPAFALIASANMASIVAVSIVRGVGFAVTCVAGGALTASLIPSERRGVGLALVGVVAGVPAVAALPLGVWLIGQVGYPPIFVAGGAAALAAMLTVPGLPDRAPSAVRPLGIVAALRSPALVRPAIIFLATTVAAGVIVTYLPVAVPQASRSLVVLALLIQPAASMLMRCYAGRYGDRRGATGLLLPGVLIAAAGVVTLALTTIPAAVLAGALLFGAGFGVAQNASLAVMYARVPASEYTTVSAVWNAAYDAGMGVGAAGFGVLATATGYSAAFALTAAVMLSVLALAWRDRKSEVTSSSGDGRIRRVTTSSSSDNSSLEESDQ